MGRAGCKESYFTAGPYEGDPILLDAYLSGKKAASVDKYKLVPLPEKPARDLEEYASLDPIRISMRQIERKPLSGGLVGIEFGGVPFAPSKRDYAVILCKERPTAVVPVGKCVKVMHLVLAAVDPGDSPLARCIIHREDGVKVDLVWEGGKNIGPSIGPWNGKLEKDPEAPVRTEVVWEGKGSFRRKKGKEYTSVRLFRTIWENDNEWYPVKQLEWKLENPSAQVLILGVTVE